LTQEQLDALQIEYDKLISDLGIQNEALTGQWNTMGTNLANEKSNQLSLVGGLRGNALSEAEANKQLNYETANNTQRANRNVLRALGILGSSAAGEILSRPQVAADRVTAEQQGVLTKRLADLDNMKVQVEQDYGNKKTELDNNYMALANQIQSDMRFGQEEKLNAMDQLRAAYAQDKQARDLAYQQWNADLEQKKVANQLAYAQIMAYTNPSNTSSILASKLTA
jgi:hypothetical protein